MKTKLILTTFFLLSTCATAHANKLTQEKLASISALCDYEIDEVQAFHDSCVSEKIATLLK
jgi:hypothetical protein